MMNKVIQTILTLILLQRFSMFEVSLIYGPSWIWSAGLMLTNDSLGFGGQVQF